MIDNDKVIEAVFAAIDEVNQFRSPEEQLEKSPETPLLGKNGKLDSLGIVNFIVATEMNLDQLFGVSINLADEQAMAQKDNPFRTIGTFTEYISAQLKAKVDGKPNA
jgi:acyl carrier protein